MREVNSITDVIIGDATTTHRDLGPGLLESTYEACLVALLTRQVERQVAIPLIYRGEQLECAHRLDLLVDKQVVVELKTVAALDPVHLLR